ncbi:MAG: hypothetical protein NVSMB38_30120 [Ktedonobacteraceae bacterium]
MSILVGVSGVAMLLLSGSLHLGVLTIIGLIMVALGVIGGFVSSAIESANDTTAWGMRPEDGLQKPTADKGQLPLGGYTSGHRRAV